MPPKDGGRVFAKWKARADGGETRPPGVSGGGVKGLIPGGGAPELVEEKVVLNIKSGYKDCKISQKNS